jgi:hypothetical protein
VFYNLIITISQFPVGNNKYSNSKGSIF